MTTAAIVGIVILVLWIAVIPAAYFKVFKNWEDNTKFERIWFSCIWPLVAMLYPIHWIHNNLG